MNNKLLKKICGIFGYRLIDKKTFKNNRILAKNSSLKIKNLLNFYFSRGKINSILQIGANDGVSFDELNYFIKKFKIKSLLVEPIKENFILLKKNYQNFEFIKLENLAISVNNELSHLYKVKPEFIKNYDKHIPAIPSFDIQHLINHGVKKNHIMKEKINSISIKDLFNKYEIRELDLFYLDAEGYDGRIVYDFLLNIEIRPLIIFEYVHIENNLLEKITLKLLEKNYLYFQIEENLFCLPKEKI